MFVIGFLILGLSMGYVALDFLGVIWIQYDHWFTEVLPTQPAIEAQDLPVILTFSELYTALTCERRGRYDCQWICQNNATGAYQECDATRSFPTAIPRVD